jgi:hypothetical protein
LQIDYSDLPENLATKCDIHIYLSISILPCIPTSTDKRKVSSRNSPILGADMRSDEKCPKQRSRQGEARSRNCPVRQGVVLVPTTGQALQGIHNPNIIQSIYRLLHKGPPEMFVLVQNNSQSSTRQPDSNSNPFITVALA